MMAVGLISAAEQEIVLPSTTFPTGLAMPDPITGGCNTARETAPGDATLANTACSASGECCAVFWAYGTNYNSSITNLLDNRCLNQAARTTYSVGAVTSTYKGTANTTTVSW